MKRWDILYTDTDATDSQDSFDLSTLTAILLANRNLESKEDIENYLYPTLDSLEITKLGIAKKDVESAKKLIQETKKKEKTIVIYGDYDVDGICATAILWETLYNDYKKIIPYIPNRVEEGYGLSLKGIDNVLEKYPDTQLIITVDNGVSAIDAVAYAKEKDVSVIVTDHHTKSETLPSADVILHTPQVCGAGVAYLFARSIDGKTHTDNRHLELATMATISDCMTLRDENRAIVKHGLKALAQTKRTGLLELFVEAKIDKNIIDVYHVGFMIAPRLNATGRLASAMDSLRLLCTVDSMRAKLLAQKLGGTNKERQDITTEMYLHAKKMVASSELQKIIVAADMSYNQGVIGLIASRLTESMYRPSVVIAIGDNGVSKGSARSVKGVNVTNLLRSVSGHLVQVGGHEMAAGFTIETDKIESFKNALLESAEQTIPDELLERVVTADIEIPFSLVNFDLYETLQKFAPFGIGNSEPTFVTKNVTIKDIKILGKEGKHLKFLLEQDDSFIEALAFGFGTSFEGKVGDSIDILYTVALDTWNGRNKVVLRIKDIHDSL